MPIDAAGGNVALRVITDVRDGYAPALQGGGIGGCALDEVDVAAPLVLSPRQVALKDGLLAWTDTSVGTISVPSRAAKM